MNTLPPEALFHVADETRALDDLARLLYSAPTPGTLAHLHRVNAHLEGGVARPGQIVIITPDAPSQCAQWEEAIGEAAAKADRAFSVLTEQERKRLARHYALMSDVASYSSLTIGASGTWLTEKAKRVEFVLKEIDDLYVSRAKTSSLLGNTDFFRERKRLFVKLDLAISGLIRRQLFDRSTSPARMKTALGLSSKSTVHQWRAKGSLNGLSSMTNHYAQLVKLSKGFSHLGYASIGLTIAGGASAIVEACNAEPHGSACRKAKYVETGRATGAVVGGTLSGVAAGRLAALSCAALIGLETGGFAVPVCIAAGSVVAGYIGAEYGGDRGARGGSILYETKVQPDLRPAR